MYSALSTLNTTAEVPLSKAPNPQLLPERCSINGCTLLRVCVHGVCSLLCVCTLDGLNAEHEFRVWVTVLGRMSHHLKCFHYRFHAYLLFFFFFRSKDGAGSGDGSSQGMYCPFQMFDINLK